MSGPAGAVGWDSIVTWCRRELGAVPARCLFASGHVARVLGIVLEDGREVVIKLRAADQRVHAALAVQRRVFDRGFACPEPLTAASLLGPLLASAEAYVRAGPLLGPPPAPECAETLAALVDLAGEPGSSPELASPLPWVAWDHPGPGLWPSPDDVDADLNDPAGPSWLQDAARRVRARLSAGRRAPVIGHCDWEAHNLGWREGHVAVVYDWDSLAIRSEPAVAGTAATVFASAAGGPVAASPEQSEDFLSRYSKTRPWWDADATELAYAAGLWVLLFNARKELAGGGTGYVDHLQRELAPRLRRAGA